MSAFASSVAAILSRRLTAMLVGKREIKWDRGVVLVGRGSWRGRRRLAKHSTTREAAATTM
jgi:hypothetical protein